MPRSLRWPALFLARSLFALMLAALPVSSAARAGVIQQCADLGQFGPDCSVAELADPGGGSGYSIVIDGVRFALVSPDDLPGASISSRILVLPIGAGTTQPGLRFEATGDALAAPTSYALSFQVDSAVANRAINVAAVSIDVEFDPSAGSGDVSGTFATLDQGQPDQQSPFADPPRSGLDTLPASLSPGNGAAPGVAGSFAIDAGGLSAFEFVVTLDGVLELAKAASSPVVNVGYDLDYMVTVSNGSPLDLTAVTLRDTLPAGVIFQSAVSSQGNCMWDGTEVLCDVGDVAGGASAQIAISGRAPLIPGPVANAATADSSQTGTATAIGTVMVRDAVADLGVSLSDDPDPVAPGGDTVYRIEVTNAGPGNATLTDLTVLLPPGAIPYQFTADPQGSCSRLANLVNCDLGTIGPSDVTPGLVVVELFVILPVEGLFTTTATVVADEPDPGGDPHQASEDTLVIVPRLAVNKTDDIDPVNTGRPFSYFLTATNYRGVTVTGVALSDVLPAGLTYVAATPDQGSCMLSSGTVSCDLGDIPPGKSAKVRLEVEAPSLSGAITNTVEVISDSDPVPIVDSEDTIVLPAIAELFLQTTTGTGPVIAGDVVTWTHQVRNDGPGNANQVVLVNDLPANAAFTGVNAGSAVSCNHLNGTVTCMLGGLRSGVLRPGESALFGISARLTAAGTAVNLATVSADEPDPGALPNSTSTSVTVLFPPDLRITDSINLPDDRLLDFGPTDAGVVAAGDLTLTNLGGQGLTIAGVSGAPQPPFNLSDPGSCLGSVLPGGGSCTLVVTFAPIGPGLFTERFVLDFGTFTAPIDLTGESPAGLADISLTKQTDRVEILIPGQPDRFTFTLAVHNAGPDAAAVEVRDKLPRGLRIPAGSPPIPSTGSYNPRNGVWSVGLLPRGRTETLILVAGQDKKFTGCVTNLATARLVDPARTDPDPTDNSAQVDVGVGGCTDLAILDISGAFLPSNPRRVQWVVTFGMIGPGSTAQGPFSIDLRLPNGANFEDLTLTGEQVAPLNCQAKGKKVLCSSPPGTSLVCGPLQGFALCRVEITATAPRRLTGPLAVTIESLTPDPVPNNNRANFQGP